MPAGIINYPKFKAFDTNGAPLAGGLLHTYAMGTTTPKTTYSDTALSVPNINPVVLDSLGEATIFASGSYKLVLADATDATIWTFDGVEFSAIGGVKISSTDMTAGFLQDKLLAGANITLVLSGAGADEKLTILSSGLPTAQGAGTVDAITATYSPALTLSANVVCTVVCTGANTIVAPTFAPNGLTARVITKYGGQPLLVGNIPRAGFVALLQYDASNLRWEIINPSEPAPSVPAKLTVAANITLQTTAGGA